MSESSTGYKSGIVSVVGRPNVGKSTLVNALVGKDIAIASAHPHTTRRAVRAILNGDNYQLVFTDTPGIHKPSSPLSEQMNEQAYDSLDDVDVIIFVIDAKGNIGKGDTYIAEKLKNRENVIVVINKCDVLNDANKIASVLAAAQELLPNAITYVPVSSFTSKNTHILLEELVNRMPSGPAFFGTDVISDMNDKQLVAEMYREQLLHKLREELPQSVTVIANEEEQDGEKRYFSLRVVVSKKSQKPIVIGKNGSMLEEVGTKARKRLEKILGCPLIIKAKVDVEENWQAKADNLDSYYF